ncbi:hypothetical protein M8J77_001412 [Diaphorina citri]|nr:hypothetical protein M8J77_001412 [Diaphorina citri]
MDIVGSTKGLAHFDVRSVHVHERRKVSGPAWGGGGRLDPPDQVCPEARQRNLRVSVDKLISIELEQNEILEKLDMLQKTVNHLMTRREAASSSTELQDLLKKLPLKTPLDFEIFQDNLTDSGQRALAIEGSTFVIGNRIEYVRVIRDYLSQAQNRINNREKSAMFKKHNIYEEAIWK